jgi:hypothetical protein
VRFRAAQTGLGGFLAALMTLLDRLCGSLLGRRARRRDGERFLVLLKDRTASRAVRRFGSAAAGLALGRLPIPSAVFAAAL